MGQAPAHSDMATQELQESPLPVTAIDGWEEEDHAAAFEAWRRFGNSALPQRFSPWETAAKEFFEENFVAKPLGTGLLTGYFEPQLDASPLPTERFGVPLYARPPDSEAVNSLDRAQIDAGALRGRGLEIAWIEDAVDAFFVHVQGSVCLNMTTGEIWRLAWDGRNGHPYSSIGAILVDSGEIEAGAISMQSLRAWLHKDRRRASALMAKNRSYIFFRRLAVGAEAPVGSSGLALLPGRSLAIDIRHLAYGTPVWIATRMAFPGDFGPLRRLTIAADTGSAITGKARGDLYCGRGAVAGEVAGRLRHDCTFFALLPRKTDREWRDAFR
jgi:peptidoglycan lytic transglycosylase A